MRSGRANKFFHPITDETALASEVESFFAELGVPGTTLDQIQDADDVDDELFEQDVQVCE